jgi:hypothetical protein
MSEMLHVTKTLIWSFVKMLLVAPLMFGIWGGLILPFGSIWFWSEAFGRIDYLKSPASESVLIQFAVFTPMILIPTICYLICAVVGAYLFYLLDPVFEWAVKDL